MLFAVEQATRAGERGGPRFILPFLLLLLIGFIVSRVIRRKRGGSHGHGHRHGSPLQTLEDRFARGEVDRQEFEHRKAVLVGAEVIPPAPQAAAPSSHGSVSSSDAVPSDGGADEES